MIKEYGLNWQQKQDEDIIQTLKKVCRKRKKNKQK